MVDIGKASSRLDTSHWPVRAVVAAATAQVYNSRPKGTVIKELKTLLIIIVARLRPQLTLKLLHQLKTDLFTITIFKITKLRLSSRHHSRCREYWATDGIAITKTRLV